MAVGWNASLDAIKKGTQAAQQAVKPYTPPAQAQPNPTTTQAAPTYAPPAGTQAAQGVNTHQQWINNPNSGQGGMESYIAKQQARYNQALAAGDSSTLQALANDMQRVGYTLNNGVPPKEPQGNMDAIMEYLKNMGQASYQQQVNSIEAAYNQAVMDGEMSVREAQEAFARESERIAAENYANGEATKLSGAQRGIGNSQQLLGMQASDSARANGLRSDASNALNTTLGNIRQRLNALSLQKNIDISNAAAQRDQMIAQGGFDLMRDDYAANRDYNYDLGLIDANTSAQSTLNKEQSRLAIEEMKVQSGLTIEQMKAKLGIDKQLGVFMNDLDLVKMAKAHGYDLDKLGKSQEFERQMLAAQQAFTASQNAKDRAQSAANAATAASSKDDGYGVALMRELAKYTPGTPEYKIVQEQIKAEQSRAEQETLNGLKTDILIDRLIKDPSIDITSLDSMAAIERALSKQGGTTQQKTSAKEKIQEAVSGFGLKGSAAQDFEQAYKDFWKMLGRG